MADTQYIYIDGKRIGETIVMSGALPIMVAEDSLRSRSDLVPYMPRFHGEETRFGKALAKKDFAAVTQRGKEIEEMRLAGTLPSYKKSKIPEPA